jgi:hypothetical protein
VRTASSATSTLADAVFRVRRVAAQDGRIRLYGYAASLGCYLRVALLSDGETVRNAIPDEGYEP